LKNQGLAIVVIAGLGLWVWSKKTAEAQAVIPGEYYPLYPSNVPGTVPPTPGVPFAGDFTFTDVKAEAVPGLANGVKQYGYKVVNFSCRITNITTDPNLTKQLRVMDRKYFPDGTQVIEQVLGLDPSVYGPQYFNLNVLPGQSRDYRLDGNFSYEVDEGIFWESRMVIPLGGGMCVWIEDAEGNKSGEVCVSG